MNDPTAYLFRWQKDTGGNGVFADIPAPTVTPLLMSNNEITDAVRQAGASGDGRAPELSTGVWEATTNMITNGGFETNATGWNIHVPSGMVASFTRDTTRAKFGNACGKLSVIAWAGPPIPAQVYVDHGGDLGGLRNGMLATHTYTWSCWVYVPSSSGVILSNVALTFLDFASGGYQTTTSASPTAYDTWQRLTVTRTVRAGATEAFVRLNTVLAAGAVIYYDGAQLEEHTNATPYVHTDGATATRPIGRVQGPASVLSVTQGWIAVRLRREVTAGDGSANLGVFGWFNAGNDYRYVYLSGANAGIQDKVSGSVADTVTQTMKSNLPGEHLIIGKWTATTLAISVDGAPFTTITKTQGLPASLGATFDLGTISQYAQVLDGEILWAATGTGTLTNADAAAIAGVSEPDLVGRLPGTPTMLWNGDGFRYDAGADPTQHYYYLPSAFQGSQVRCNVQAQNASGTATAVASNAISVQAAGVSEPNVAEPSPVFLAQLDVAPMQFAPLPPAPSFVDVTRFLRQSITVQHGRQNELDRIEAGQVAVTLDSSIDHRFEPEYSGPTLSMVTNGNEMTDSVRAAMSKLVPGTGIRSSDGRFADSSFAFWEATTSFIDNGSFETNLNTWAAMNSGAIFRVATDSKFGGYCLQYNAGTGGGEGGAMWNSGTMGLTNAQVYTFSAWVKPPAGTQMRVQVNGTSAPAGAVAGASTPVADGFSWYRITLTFTAVATSTANTLFIILNGINTPGTCYIDGVQMEAKPNATPYVHTDGGIASRGWPRVQAPASLLAAQGWAAFRLRPGWASNAAPAQNPVVFDWRTDDNNLIQLVYDPATSKFRLHRYVAGVQVAATTAATVSFSAGDLVTVVVAWTAAQLKLSVNGAAFVIQADARSVTPTGLIDIGQYTGTGYALNGEMLWAAFGTGTLTDADAALLALYDTDPLFATLAYTDPQKGYQGPLPQAANVTGIWRADSTLINIPQTSLFYPNIVPMRRVRVQCVYGTVLYNMGVGYWNPQLQWPDYRREYLSLSATDGFEAISGANIKTILPAGQSGTQIQALLRAANWQGQIRGTDQLDAGDEPMIGVTGSPSAPQPVLTLIQTIADSEQGLFFMDGAGRAVFHSRDRRISAVRSTVSQAIFGDGSPASGELPYQSLTPDYDKQRIANDVEVTSGVVSAAPQASLDPESAGQYSGITLSRTSNLANDGAAKNQADRLASDFRNPFIRYPEMTARPWRDLRLWPLLLGIELSDRITVNRRPYGLGAVVQKVMYVEGVRHEITIGNRGQMDDWQTTMYLALADKTHYWVLEDPAYGMLDQTAILR